MAIYSIGDHVSWDSEAGRVSGSIISVHHDVFDCQGHHHRASGDDPQHEVKSDRALPRPQGRRADEDRLLVAQFTTIGHSSRGLDEFLRMLLEAQVGLLVDVRAFPRSRENPAFNIDSLPDELARVQIGYRHCPALGGRRPRQPGVDPVLNGLWRVQSFHNYADYALGQEFGAAFGELVELGRDRRLALMCSEAVWWRCHGRIIADYLLLNGHAVDHLMGPGQIDAARPTPGAQSAAGGKVVYPPVPTG